MVGHFSLELQHDYDVCPKVLSSIAKFLIVVTL